MPVISVIIPVYNASKYLNDCLESIIAQDIKYPFEIICVNDGSKDNSLEILESYSSKYDFIKVIDQSNSGSTLARNTGINNASGDWILFVDSDDKLPKDALSNLFIPEADKHDIIIGEVMRANFPKTMGIEEYRKKMISDSIPSYACGKLFRKKLFKENTLNIPREIVKGEDKLMNIRLAFATEKPVKFVGKNVYIYNRVATSISHTFISTPEYEVIYHNFLLESIPLKFQESYSTIRITAKIKSWKYLNLLKLSTKPYRTSPFYINLKREIKESNYPLSISEWIQLNGNSIPLRLIALYLNIYPILLSKIRRMFWNSKLGN